MFSFLGIIALLALCVVSFIQPIVPVMVYTLLGQIETPQMMDQIALNTAFNRPRLIYIVILAFGIIYSKLWKSYQRGELSKRHAFLVCCATALTGWMCLSYWMHDDSISRTILFIMSSGPLGIVFSVAFRRNPYARIALYLVVLIHIGLSILIYAVPGGRWTDLACKTINANGMEEVGGVASSNQDEVGYSYKGIRRGSAQFENSIPLGFYGALAVLVGVYIGLNRKGLFWALLSVLSFVFGGLALYITSPRAIICGAVIGGGILISGVKKTVFSRLVITGMILAFVCGIWWVFENSASNTAAVIRDHFATMMDDNGYRAKAAIKSVDVLFDYPFFGVGDSAKMVDLVGGAPHQSFYFMSVIFGLPAGICTLILTYIVAIALFIFPSGRMTEGLGNERQMAKAVGVIVLAMALTNNMSAGFIGWVCLGYACLPWAENGKFQKISLFKVPCN